MAKRFVGYVITGKNKFKRVRLVKGEQPEEGIQDIDQITNPMIAAALRLGGLVIIYKHHGQDQPEQFYNHTWRLGNPVLARIRN